VLYLHGGGIDAPLAVTRLGLHNQPTAVTTVPHADWTGDYVNGTLLNGTAQSTCTGTSGCPVVLWPGGRTTTDGVPVWAAPATSGWWGSLLQGQADASGLRYQRNRFYDPSTGQFTQEDLIGLAGGRNLYAFAGGDPINFRDPFGLMACPPMCGFDGDPRNVERETRMFESRSPHDNLAMLAVIGAAGATTAGLRSLAVRLLGTLPSVAAVGAASAPAAPKLVVQFGRVANQVSHAFRHTDRAGLTRSSVRSAIEAHLPGVADQLRPGQPLNQVIDVGGTRIQYTAYKISQGVVNVGRIHPVP